MGYVFNVKDRQNTFDDIVSIAKECNKIISLVQVGSGSAGYHDEKSDLDFVVALDSGNSMLEVMDFMQQRICEKYDVSLFRQDEARHLQVYVLANLLEIDIGYGGYQHAAAIKPGFKVIYDKSGTVEDKMNQSREYMDDRIFGDKYKKDVESIRNSFWLHLMHAAVAVNRGNTLRAIGELEFVRNQYIDLLGDRHRLESAFNREMDNLPEDAKDNIRSTYVFSENPKDLWKSILNLTDLIYEEMKDYSIPISQELLCEYYNSLK